MLTESVIEYVSAMYGILVGAFFPLIYLDIRLYFRKNRLGFRNILRYMGRLFILIILISLLVNVLFFAIDKFGSKDSITHIFESVWYFIGFLTGLVGAISLCIFGLRRARKKVQNDGKL